MTAGTNTVPDRVSWVVFPAAGRAAA